MNGNIVEMASRLDGRLPVKTRARLPCQEHDARLWFSSLPSEVKLAKAYCQGCPNRAPCLTGALERAEVVGVWGGEIFDQGRIVTNRRPRGRPRKSTAA